MFYFLNESLRNKTSAPTERGKLSQFFVNTYALVPLELVPCDGLFALQLMLRGPCVGGNGGPFLLGGVQTWNKILVLASKSFSPGSGKHIHCYG